MPDTNTPAAPAAPAAQPAKPKPRKRYDIEITRNKIFLPTSAFKSDEEYPAAPESLGTDQVLYKVPRGAVVSVEGKLAKELVERGSAKQRIVIDDED